MGRRLARTLVERGDDVVAFVRSAAQITDLTELGAHVALVDLAEGAAVARSGARGLPAQQRSWARGRGPC